MKDMYVPDGFSIITEPCVRHTSYAQWMKCPECIEKALRISRLAYESPSADLRKHEGMERPYESEDTSEPRQTINIGDGMTEALALHLSNSYIKEEEDSIYSHNLRNTLKPCAWCNLMTAQPNGECTECQPKTPWVKVDRWCLSSQMNEDQMFSTHTSCPIGNHANWAPSNRPFIG